MKSELDRQRWTALQTVTARAKSRGSDDSGAAAVEFALVLLPLTMVLFGIIGFSIIFTQMQTLSAAAKDAARAGVVTYIDPIGCDDLITIARNQSDTIGLNPADVAVTVSLGDSDSLPDNDPVVCSSASPSDIAPCANAGDSGAEAQLTVRLHYTSSVNLAFLEPEFNLEGVGTFRCEYSQ